MAAHAPFRNGEGCTRWRTTLTGWEAMASQAVDTMGRLHGDSSECRIRGTGREKHTITVTRLPEPTMPGPHRRPTTASSRSGHGSTAVQAMAPACLADPQRTIAVRCSLIAVRLQA